MINKIKKRLLNIPGSRAIRALLQPRDFHAYCIGAPKTGTHSVAGLFSTNYRAAHEPAWTKTIEAIELRRRGWSPESQSRFLQIRDRHLWLEMESAHPIASFVDVLVDLFPSAKFILTIRRPRTWLNSLANQHLNVTLRQGSAASRLRDLYHHTPSSHQPGEKVLRDNGLYTVDGYLSYWSEHNRKVLDHVPENRRLILWTHNLSESVDQIARFVNIPPNSLDQEKRHKYKASKKIDFIRSIDTSLLSRKIDEHCSEVLDRIGKF